MSKISKKSPDKTCKAIGDHKKYLARITKTLYYGKLSKNDSLSLPVTELATELFSEAQRGKSLERLYYTDAANISRNACVSPCSLVLAMLYLERLKSFNPEYLDRTAPADLFLVSLMVSSKFLFDDGESDEVYVDEWATSGGITVKSLVKLEKEFLKAIDWELYVNELTFWKKLNELETMLAAKQGILRGYFTYTELQNLATTIELHNLFQCVVAVSVILAATYTAGLITLVGSVFLVSQVPGTSLYMKKLDNQEHNILPAITFDNAEPELDKTETEFNSKCTFRNMDVVDVLKTSIFLASIKANVTEDLGETDNNAQYISWDYWNIPVMAWLAKSSEFVKSYALDVPLHYFPYYLETSVSNLKCIELEDQIHKATKTRIQDQLEPSWHTEWADTMKLGMFFNRVIPHYVHNIKS